MVQVKSVEHFAKELFLGAFQLMPFAHLHGLMLVNVAGNETVACHQFALRPPVLDRKQLCYAPPMRLVAQEGVVHLAVLSSCQRRQRLRCTFQRPGKAKALTLMHVWRSAVGTTHACLLT